MGTSDRFVTICTQCRLIDYNCKCGDEKTSPFKVGDWVRVTCEFSTTIQKIYNITHAAINFEEFSTKNINTRSFAPLNDRGFKIELWQPTEGEWCVFWDRETTDRYSIRKYRNKVPQGYFDVTSKVWTNIAPLEFIQTLKDTHA